MGWLGRIKEKLNPAQQAISFDQGITQDTEGGDTGHISIIKAYDQLEVVRRGTDMIVAGVVSLDFDVLKTIPTLDPIVSGVRKTKLNKLLNFQPNAYQDKNAFISNLVMDLILEGNGFMYYDGVYLYNLPADRITIETDPKTFIKGYIYRGAGLIDGTQTTFTPEEIIHIKDNSSSSIFRGSSRLLSASNSISKLNKMQAFQKNFFVNGAVPGLVLETDNPIPDKIKQRMIASWGQIYNPSSGGKRPLILDNGLKLKPLFNANFTELDFLSSIKEAEDSVLQALGVQGVLLRSGNNANISPNLRLFYLETVLPIARKITTAFERYFGYDVEVIPGSNSALQPDMKEQSSYHSTLVNGGIIAPNEARANLRYAPDPDPASNKLRIPANIAGSAANPEQGGKPPEDTSNGV
jgi:HK97 family phage portal protein